MIVTVKELGQYQIEHKVKIGNESKKIYIILNESCYALYKDNCIILEEPITPIEELVNVPLDYIENVCIGLYG